MTAKKYKLSRVKSSGDGLVHYRTARGEFDPCSTFCTDVDTGYTYVETTEKVDCAVCKHTASVFRNGVIL